MIIFRENTNYFNHEKKNAKLVFDGIELRVEELNLLYSIKNKKNNEYFLLERLLDSNEYFLDFWIC